MSATVESVARAALGDLAVDATGLLNGKRWVNDRLAELAGRQRLRQLRRLGELTIPAPITTGTVTVTQGSTTVTGNAAAAAAWSIAVQGRSLRIQRVWYTIAGTDLLNNVLFLDQPYSEDSASGVGYELVARTVALPEACRTVVGFFHQRLSREVLVRTLPWLDLMFPTRDYLTTGPQFVADIGVDTATRRRMVEFYPYSTQTELIRFAYYVAPPELDYADPIPPTVDQDALTQGVLASVMRWKMAKAADNGQADIAAFWRNEYRAQETKWELVLQRLLKADTVLEDLTWITRSTRGTWGLTDIATAREEVWARGARP